MSESVIATRTVRFLVASAGTV